MLEKPILTIEKSDHLVVLDQHWHQLMDGRKTRKIKSLENQLNKLLKEQGKVNTEYEGYKKLKKQMMDDIVANMATKDSRIGERMAQNGRKIKSINQKFDHYEEKKQQLPSAIEAVNVALIRESMTVMYKELMRSKLETKRLSDEVKTMEGQLNAMKVRKEEQEKKAHDLYGFIHGIVGIDVIEQLDRYYFGGDQ